MRTKKSDKGEGVDFYCIFCGRPTVTKQYKFGTSVSWEGNRRSGVALAMRHRQ